MKDFFFLMITLSQLTTLVTAYQPTDKSALVAAVADWVGGDNTTYGHINSWDTSLLTDMSGMFRDRSEFNDDISHWNLSGVTDTSYMFC